MKENSMTNKQYSLRIFLQKYQNYAFKSFQPRHFTEEIRILTYFILIFNSHRYAFRFYDCRTAVRFGFD